MRIDSVNAKQQPCESHDAIWKRSVRSPPVLLCSKYAILNYLLMGKFNKQSSLFTTQPLIEFYKIKQLDENK